MRNKIPNLIIERAAELWGRKLHTPVFDNGDNTHTGGMTHALATMNIQLDKSGIVNIEKQVDDFKKYLVSDLVALRDGEEYFPTWLDTDYNPCKQLARAAEKAGIPESQFSCKSSVSMNEDYVSTSFGYGADSVNHYPLPDGRWLIAKLHGSDIDKIIDQVMQGNLMGLTVEG